MGAISYVKTKLQDRTRKNPDISKGYDLIKLESIKKGTPFITLFPIKQEVLKSITEDMTVNGYDVSQPVIIWKETNLLIDGHTRCEAAKKAGLQKVVVIYESFTDVDSALKYAYGLQFKRRNLTDSDKFHFAETYLNNVGHEHKKGGWKKKELAEILTVSVGTAQKYLTVLTRGTEKMKEAVKDGSATINKTYKTLIDREKPKPAEINNQSPSNKPRTEFVKEDSVYDRLDRWSQESSISVLQIRSLVEIISKDYEVNKYIFSLLDSMEEI